MDGKLVEEASYRNKKFIFNDRVHAGELLASKLRGHVDPSSIVLAIPAGGVPVGYAISKKLKVPFDVLIVRKIQVPWNPEAGFGAVAWDGTTILNEYLVLRLGLDHETIQRCLAKTKAIVRERVKKFRDGREFPDLKGRTAVLVDDGLASGFTMLVAVKSVRKMFPKRIIVAVPTSSIGAVHLLLPHVDTLVCLNVREEPIFAVADAYKRWYDLSDEEVLTFLKFSSSKSS